jgi:2-haloacid dehalogenase
MKYKHLLFDADDTLLDFQASEQEALKGLFESLGLTITDDLVDKYHEINHGLWAAFERGEVTKDEILQTRFRKLFAAIGFEIDRPSLEAEYQEMLASGHMVIPGTFELLDQLRGHFELYIVSNGVASTQYNRLHASGLFPYFQNIFISEETGYQKPQIEFFQYVFDRIPEFDSSKALIIGDSLSSDIQGGINANIDTCWYNPNKLVNNKGLKITKEISNLDQLCDIVFGS